MRMRSRYHVGPCLMHARVYGKGGLIDRPVALNHIAIFVHHHQVRHPDVAEMHPEWVDPKMIVPLGIANGDVSGNAFTEAELCEQAERRRQTLFAMKPLFAR